MALERKIMADLRRWKQQEHKMSLVLQGARQVGKTFIVDEFSKEYAHYVSINFEQNDRYRQIFDGSLEVDSILSQISLFFPDAQFVSGETLLFLDEIQSCPRAQTALKFFTIDGRFDVIASGSLLGIHYAEPSSFPVGYVERLTMHSLDFEEYCLARGVRPDHLEKLAEHYERREPVPSATHDTLMALFREHMVIGGMPHVVQTFVDTHNYAQARTIQQGIVDDYLDDIARYASDSEKAKAKAKACFLSVPSQLARDRKKFTYSIVEPRSGARKFAGSLQWLYDAGIVTFCHNVSRIELPLEGCSIPNDFKVYMRDTGLLMAMFEDASAARRIVNDRDLGIYKGALFENIVADELVKNGRRLYYFSRNSKIEVDFVMRHRGVSCAVEVKSSSNRKSKSLASALENHGAQRGIKLSPSNIGEQGDVLICPLYMAHLVARESESTDEAIPPADPSALFAGV